MAVVDLLEVVEVDDEEGQRRAVGLAATAGRSRAALDLAPQGAVEGAAVADPGQRVAVGELAPS